MADVKPLTITRVVNIVISLWVTSHMARLNDLECARGISKCSASHLSVRTDRQCIPGLLCAIQSPILCEKRM